MKIAIDLTSLSDNFSGLERVALELTGALIRCAAGAEFVLVIKNEIPKMLTKYRPDGRVRFCRIRGRNKLIANQLTLPLTMSRIKTDAYLFPAFPVPLLFNKKNTYGMIADLCCFDHPQTMKKKQVLFFKKGNIHTAKICKKVITVSEFSKERIESVLSPGIGKVLMIYDGINIPEASSYSQERIRAVKEKYGLPDSYILSLSTIEPRKNLRLLTEAYLELISKEGRGDDESSRMPSLVLAGRRGWMVDDEIAAAVESGRIIFTGFVEDDDLPALYGGAEAFVFPSLYEGFGLPPLEAQACGVRRVLSSDAPALREVLADTARFFKNNDKQSLKAALRELLSWEGADSAKIAANLSRFDWDESARKLWKEIGEKK